MKIIINRLEVQLNNGYRGRKLDEMKILLEIRPELDALIRYLHFPVPETNEVPFLLSRENIQFIEEKKNYIPSRRQVQ